jgi:hypothetical protein
MQPNPSQSQPAGASPDWLRPLQELEALLYASAEALSRLRQALEPGALEAVEPDAADAGRAAASFERLWERIAHERLERDPGEGQAAEEPAKLRGLDLLPQQYLMTIEDRESAVDLVPLHRALGGFAAQEDVSLVSFANGTPVVSLRVKGELDLDRFGAAIGSAMDRECEVIDQGNNRLFLRLRLPDDGG